MEFTVRHVVEKTCFVSIPLSFLQEISQGSFPPTRLLIDASSLPVSSSKSNSIRKWKFAWAGSVSQQETLNVPVALAKSIGIDDGIKVLITASSFNRIPSATSITVEPASPDDWEIIELNSSYLEENILSQVGFVWKDQKLPIWVRNQTCLYLHVTSTMPKAQVWLNAGTEIAIAPKLRESKTKSKEKEKEKMKRGSEEGSVDDDVFMKWKVLRVLSMDEYLPFDMGKTEGWFLPSGTIMINPKTAKIEELKHHEIVEICTKNRAMSSNAYVYEKEERSQPFMDNTRDLVNVNDDGNGGNDGDDGVLTVEGKVKNSDKDRLDYEEMLSLMDEKKEKLSEEGKRRVFAQVWIREGVVFGHGMLSEDVRVRVNASVFERIRIRASNNFHQSIPLSIQIIPILSANRHIQNDNQNHHHHSSLSDTFSQKNKRAVDREESEEEGGKDSDGEDYKYGDDDDDDDDHENQNYLQPSYFFHSYFLSVISRMGKDKEDKKISITSSFSSPPHVEQSPLMDGEEAHPLSSVNEGMDVDSKKVNVTDMDESNDICSKFLNHWIRSLIMNDTDGGEIPIGESSILSFRFRVNDYDACACDGESIHGMDECECNMHHHHHHRNVSVTATSLFGNKRTKSFVKKSNGRMVKVKFLIKIGFEDKVDDSSSSFQVDSNHHRQRTEREVIRREGNEERREEGKRRERRSKTEAMDFHSSSSSHCTAIRLMDALNQKKIKIIFSPHKMHVDDGNRYACMHRLSNLSWLKPHAELALDRLKTILSSSCHALRQKLNLPPLGGILLCGQRGSGKSNLSIAMAEELRSDTSCMSHAVVLKCAELAGDKPAVIRHAILSCVEEALEFSPSLIIFDDLDHLLPSSPPGSPFSNPLTASLSEFLSELMNCCQQEGKPIAFMAVVREKNALPPLLSPSIFDFAIQLPSPAVTERVMILEKAIKRRNAACDSKILSQISLLCQGFISSDVEVLADRAVYFTAKRHLSSSNHLLPLPLPSQSEFLNFHSLPSQIQHSAMAVASHAPFTVHLLKEDFIHAFNGFTPASMRGTTKSTPSNGVKEEGGGWERIGGLNAVKDALREVMEMPSRHGRLFAKSPLRLRSGVLLYGPPGCGKTFSVSSAATACNLPCIAVKGPELLNKYIGASEQAVRDVFSRASSASPCILFFDEFDSIAPRRGHDNTGVTDRVVNQFLTELDGVEGLSGVIVIAATSRPDLIDPALLRPGRLDRLLLCDFPDSYDRYEILVALSRNLHLHPDMDWKEIADRTDGFSGADLQALLSEAQLEAVNEVLDECNGLGVDEMEGMDKTRTKSKARTTPVIGFSQVHAALAKARPSVSITERMKLDKVYDMFSRSKSSMAVSSRESKGKRVTLA